MSKRHFVGSVLCKCFRSRMSWWYSYIFTPRQISIVINFVMFCFLAIINWFIVKGLVVAFVTNIINTCIVFVVISWNSIEANCFLGTYYDIFIINSPKQFTVRQGFLYSMSGPFKYYFLRTSYMHAVVGVYRNLTPK